MKSPFPGMDPYIEACGLWKGFHNHLIESIYRSLSPILPKGYSVDTADRSYVVLVEPTGKEESPAIPDVTITETSTPKQRRSKKGAGVAVAEPPLEAEARPMR